MPSKSGEYSTRDSIHTRAPHHLTSHIRKPRLWRVPTYVPASTAATRSIGIFRDLAQVMTTIGMSRQTRLGPYLLPFSRLWHQWTAATVYARHRRVLPNRSGRLCTVTHDRSRAATGPLTTSRWPRPTKSQKTSRIFCKTLGSILSMPIQSICLRKSPRIPPQPKHRLSHPSLLLPTLWNV